MVEQNGFVAIMPKLIAKYAVSLFDVEYRPIDVDMNRKIGFAVKSKSRYLPRHSNDSSVASRTDSAGLRTDCQRDIDVCPLPL